MKAWDVVGYTYEDGYALCADCAEHDEVGLSGTVFAIDETDAACDECHAPLKDD